MEEKEKSKRTSYSYACCGVTPPFAAADDAKPFVPRKLQSTSFSSKKTPKPPPKGGRAKEGETLEPAQGRHIKALDDKVDDDKDDVRRKAPRSMERETAMAATKLATENAEIGP